MSEVTRRLDRFLLTCVLLLSWLASTLQSSRFVWDGLRCQKFVSQVRLRCQMLRSRAGRGAFSTNDPELGLTNIHFFTHVTGHGTAVTSLLGPFVCRHFLLWTCLPLKCWTWHPSPIWAAATQQCSKDLHDAFWQQFILHLCHVVTDLLILPLIVWFGLIWHSSIPLHFLVLRQKQHVLCQRTCFLLDQGPGVGLATP